MEDREEPQAGSTSHRPRLVSARGNSPWHLFLTAGLAVAVFALAWSEVGAPASSSRVSRQVVLAQRGVVQSTVSGTGNVEAGTDVSVNFKASGTLADVFVKVGDHVSQGQLLATLDPTSAQLSVAQAEKTLTAANDQLKAARQTPTSSSTSSTTTGASLQTHEGGSAEFVSETVRQVPSAITTTTTTTRSQGTPHPRPKRKTSGRTTVPQTTTTTTTPASTQAAPQGPTTTAAGSSSASGTVSATTKAANIATAQASVYSAEANLRSAETSVANTKLYAPTSGTIVSLSTLQPGDQVSSGTSNSGVAGSSSGGSSSGNSGTGAATAGSLGGSGSSSSSSSSVSSSSAFAEIVNTDTMTMTVALSESDVTKVRVGQPATITLDALSGVELSAHVSQIATVGTTSSSVVSYSATLTLDQLDRRVKAGMSASASVITSQASGITVPNSAVSGSGTLTTLRLMRGGKTIQQQVVVGLKGDSRTQIVSGLRAGDQLVVTTTLPSLGSGSTGSSAGSNGTLGGGRGFGGGGFPGGGFPGGGPPGGGGG